MDSLPACYRCDRQPCECRDGITLYHADCRDILPLLEPGSVDLVLTDPPYPAEFAWCWDLLAVQGNRLLECGSSLVTLVGNSQLDRAMKSFRGYLRYWWCGGMLNPGIGTRLPGKWVFSTGKPCLWYVKFRRRKNDTECPVDFRNGGGKEKWGHPWQQPLGWFKHWGERLCKSATLDPFAGSGTTGRACKDLGRRCIQIEIEERYVEIAARRLEQNVLFT